MTPLDSNEMLLLRGAEGTLGIVKVGEKNQFYLETDKEEIILALGPEDLLVASGFGTDETIVNGLKCVLFIIREVRSPFIVLPKNHPASKRLKIVVSAGDSTRISCSITPGTHPEQDILCGSNEFDGVEISGVKGGVEFKNLAGGNIERVPFGI
ncbi:MAG: hypothetical protein FIB08_11735 [Candidatus Methanoperedens sp.]|nr:hypothetical protein [Candidatus Methanoperedens sp.]